MAVIHRPQSAARPPGMRVRCVRFVPLLLLSAVSVLMIRRECNIAAAVPTDTLPPPTWCSMFLIDFKLPFLRVLAIHSGSGF